MFAPIKTQKEVFEYQIKYAIENNMPLSIHGRQAHNVSMFILKNFMSKWISVVMHCFTGTNMDFTLEPRNFTFSFVGLNCEIPIRQIFENGNKIRNFEIYRLKEVNWRIMSNIEIRYEM